MEVVLNHPEHLRVIVLAFGSNVKMGLEMIKNYNLNSLLFRIKVKDELIHQLPILFRF